MGTKHIRPHKPFTRQTVRSKPAAKLQRKPVHGTKPPSIMLKRPLLTLPILRFSR